MDEKYLELASEHTARMADAQKAAVAKAAIPDTDLKPEQYKALECKECEDPLPVFRMKKGLTLCTSCQDRLERARKR